MWVQMIWTERIVENGLQMRPPTLPFGMKHLGAHHPHTWAKVQRALPNNVMWFFSSSAAAAATTSSSSSSSSCQCSSIHIPPPSYHYPHITTTTEMKPINSPNNGANPKPFPMQHQVCCGHMTHPANGFHTQWVQASQRWDGAGLEWCIPLVTSSGILKEIEGHANHECWSACQCLCFACHSRKLATMWLSSSCCLCCPYFSVFEIFQFVGWVVRRLRLEGSSVLWPSCAFPVELKSELSHAAGLSLSLSPSKSSRRLGFRFWILWQDNNV